MATEDTGAPEGAPTEEIAPIPAALKEVNPEILAALREKVKAFAANKGTTASGSEAPDTAPQVTEEGNPIAQVQSGRDVDWSLYDLPFELKHLYKDALYRETPQGPKWVVNLEEFYSTSCEARAHGKMVNATIGSGATQPLNLGEFLTNTLAGSEGWQIGAILPTNNEKAIVLMKRPQSLVLPDPIPLKTEAEVEAPTDPELQNIEDAALEFAASEGLAAPEIEDVGEAEAEMNFAARVVPRDAVEVEEGTNAIPARTAGALVRDALDRAQATTVPSPAPLQPEPIYDNAGNPTAAGVVNVREGMKNILNGPDFGTA